MDEEVTTDSDSERGDHDAYATFGADDADDGQNAIGQRESSGLETATMSPINSHRGDHSIFDDVPLPREDPFFRDRPSEGYSMPSAMSGGFTARDAVSSGLLIRSMTGGGVTPAVALWKSPLRSDDFLSARGGETHVRREPTDFSAALAPSHSTTNLLGELEQKLSEKDTRVRQLEESLNDAERRLESASEELGAAWNDKDATVSRLEKKRRTISRRSAGRSSRFATHNGKRCWKI